MEKEDRILEKLKGLNVLDENGAAAEMSSLWQNQRTVLVFIRHFG